MKILFLLGAASRIRNFDRTIMLLAERGHVIRVAGRLRKGAFTLPEQMTHERISARVNPTERVDEWRDFVDLVRGARDYLRYFDPRYARATRLVRRAYEIAPTELVLFCERHPWVKRHWNIASRVLALCEQLIPADPGFEEFLREEAPDLVLVTPLVTFESYQTDYIKAAHRLGVPVAFIPFSWDNLTNKGLMRVHPDRVLVWNDVQKREAIELHGAAPDSVAVTGAARFDDFFARTAATTRADFFAEYGLDPARPMVLYLGSSQLTGPNEMELVRRWAESLRGADDEILRSCAILVRPHPAVRDSWGSVDLSELGQVAISRQVSRNADQELFDSLHHAHAAVGLNTSAMLEAAIAGKPVYTLLIPGFDEGQVGTIHFQYLVEAYGGLATVARDFEQHHRQLAATLRGAPMFSASSRAFAEAFLRPHGIERPVSPILASEIERASGVQRRPQQTPFWHYPLRAALRRWAHRRMTDRGGGEDTTVVATWMSLRRIRTTLEEIRRSSTPVLIGPWVDTTANELLYWIPFLRWACATYGLAPDRTIVVSRNAAHEWYGSIARRQLDLATLFSQAELDHWLRRTVPQSERNPEEATMAPFDQEIVERAARQFELSDYRVLHPSLVFRLLQRLRQERALENLSEVFDDLQAERTKGSLVAGLPRSFVAVSLTFTDALPATPENHRLLDEVVLQLAARGDVVIVDSVLTPGGGASAARVFQLPLLTADWERPDVRMSVLARAQTFVGPYGDLAVLAAFCGTPVVAYQSERLPNGQFERLQSLAATAGWGDVTLQRARRFKGVRLPASVHA